MSSDVEGMLGLCARARGLVSGAFAVEQGLKRGNVGLVLADCSLSAASRRVFEAKCAHARIRIAYIEPEGALGCAIGKVDIKLVGIVHKSFLNRVLELMERA